MSKREFSIPFLVTFILLVGCLPQISSDIYAPSLPAIAHYFSTTVHHAQWSMALYMSGIAIFLFIYGPLSDGIGRKPPLIAGLLITLIGTLLCLFATSIEMLLIGRFVQGSGVGACAGLWRSIARDVFSGDELAKYSSYFMIFVVFVVPAAPVLGGYLQEHFNWHASFVFLLVYAVIALYIVIVHFRETSEHHDISRIKYDFICHAFRHLLTSRIFMGHGLSVLLTYGAFFSWFTIGPVLFINIAHVTPANFGWLTFISSCSAMAIGGFINARLVKRYGSHNMLQFGWGIMLVSGILLLVTYAALGIHVPAITACLFVFFFGVTFIWPNAFAGAMEPFDKIAGYAGATYSALQLGGGAVVAGVAAHAPDSSQMPFAIIVISCAISAWLVYRFIAYPAVVKRAIEEGI